VVRASVLWASKVYFVFRLPMTRQIRCAIYTRKSSEEGLEQSFNSLEAQREACQAFILSQKHEGWKVLNGRYDDGGFSGGTMERPALKRLLTDIREHRIDAVVVYKVDRLTRSLSDFSKIIEVFESQKVSFVSVTQQFNTTTSMGRLTLNVLLSFAQFEREVTGERIRDKIAASKKKGMWMGGTVPLGYDCADHRLVVNETEAETVREIFRRYLRLRCVRSLKASLDKDGIRSKVRPGSRTGTRGGASFSRGALYRLLKNRTYIGEVQHRDQSYPAQHQAIVPRPLWDGAATCLAANNQAHRTKAAIVVSSLLTGKIFDGDGVRLTPTQARKGSRRYRYYTSRATIEDPASARPVTRLPAQGIEDLVRQEIRSSMEQPGKYLVGIRSDSIRHALADAFSKLSADWPKNELAKQDQFIRSVLHRVVVGGTAVTIEIDRWKLIELSIPGPRPANRSQTPAIVKLSRAFRIVRRGVETNILAPADSAPHQGMPIPSLVKAVARAYDWYERIAKGETIATREIARQNHISGTYVRRMMQCAVLSPQIVEAILNGRHRPELVINDLIKVETPVWQFQEKEVLRS
jgi:site-specific DNA recombinase